MGKVLWIIGFVMWAMLVAFIQITYVTNSIKVPEMMDFVANLMMFYLVSTLAFSYWRNILYACWLFVLCVMRLPAMIIGVAAALVSVAMTKYDNALLKVNAFVSPAKKSNYL